MHVSAEHSYTALFSVNAFFVHEIRVLNKFLCFCHTFVWEKIPSIVKTCIALDFMGLFYSLCGSTFIETQLFVRVHVC